MKEKALGESGIVRRPSQPVIGYLAAAQDEESKDLVPTISAQPVGFIGLDDDDDHGFERAFGGFQRKGQGGDSADDRGGGGLPAASGSGSVVGGGIWGMVMGGDAGGGLHQGGHRLDELFYDRQVQAEKKLQSQ